MGDLQSLSCHQHSSPVSRHLYLVTCISSPVSRHLYLVTPRGTAMSERKDPPYFMYFPGNYRWSAAILGMLSTAGWGGSDINEVDKIGRLLRGAKVGDDDAWFAACLE